MSLCSITYDVDALRQAAPNGQVRVIHSRNPFDTSKHIHSFHDLDDGVFLSDIVSDEIKALPEESAVVSVNGEVITKKEWDAKVLHSSDVAVIFEVPGGGGDDSKAIFRLVLMVVVAVVAPYAVPATWGPVASAAFQVAFIVSGALLINALIPPAIPDSASSVDSLADSPTYGIDGAKNTSGEGIPIPICYGGFRMAGNILNFHTRNESDDQYLYLLFNAGEGVVSGITEVELNDQPIEGFQDVETVVRLGDSGNSPVQWFEESVSPTAIGVVVNTGFQTRTTGVIDRFRLDFVCPSGLVEFKDDGSKFGRSIEFNIEYKLTTEPTVWTTMYNQAAYDSSSTVYHYYQFNVYDPDGNVNGTTPTENRSTLRDVSDTVSAKNIIHDVDGIAVGYTTALPDYAKATNIVRRQTSAVRFSFYSPDLVEGAYNIRVKRTTAESVDVKIQDSVTWSDLNEIVSEKVGYKHTALLGLKMRLTDQLSSLPNISYFNGGIVCKAWNKAAQNWENTPTTNPAWIAWDIQTNTRYGGQMPESRLDVDAYINWGEYCDTEGLTFQGVFDQPMSLWDSLMHVMRAGHAMPVRIGTQHSIAIDRPTTPSQMFTVGNIIKGSFQQKWMSIVDRANEVALTYFDETDKFKARIIKVYDNTIPSSSLPKTASVTMFGVVDATRAAEEATFMLLANKYVRSTVQFKCAMEAVAVAVGDVFVLQHDQPDWSWGGRLESGSTVSALQIDRPITFDVAKLYTALVRYDTRVIVTTTVLAKTVGGRRLQLDAPFAGETNVDRIVRISDGVDKRITNIEADAVWVEDGTSILVGDAVELIQVDSIETRAVTAGTSGVLTAVPLNAALPEAPGQYTLFMIGETATVNSLWRTTKVSVDEHRVADISGAEYNESIYNWTPLTAQPPPDTGYNRIVPHVINLDATESTTNIGGILRPVLDLSWSLPANFDNYAGVMIELSIDGEGYRFAKLHIAAELHTTVEVGHADNISVRVIAKSADGRYALNSTAPSVTGLSIAGDPIAPAVPTSFAVSVGTVGLNLSWVNPIDADFGGVDIKRHPSNDEPSATLIYTTEKRQISWLDDQATDTGLSYYYWARSVDQNGNLSAWVASTPTNETPSDFGVDATSGYLTNEQHGVIADSDGSNPVFSGANGEFQVFKGITDITDACTFSVFAADNLTGTINTALDTPVTGPEGYYEVTAETSPQDIHSFGLRAVTPDAITIDKVFTLIKNKGGVNAKTVHISAEGLSFSYNNDDGVTTLVGPAQIDLLINEQNTTGTTTWEAWDDAAVSISPVSTLLSAVTDSGATITESDFNGITNNAFVKVRATRNGVADEVTIHKITAGTGNPGSVFGPNAADWENYASFTATPHDHAMQIKLDWTNNRVYFKLKGANTGTTPTPNSLTYDYEVEVIGTTLTGLTNVSATATFTDLTGADVVFNGDGADEYGDNGFKHSEAVGYTFTDEIYITVGALTGNEQFRVKIRQWSEPNGAISTGNVWAQQVTQIINLDDTYTQFYFTPNAGQTIVWRGALAAAPSNPLLNWAYYDTVLLLSRIWDGNSWETLSIDGSPGLDGDNGADGQPGIPGASTILLYDDFQTTANANGQYQFLTGLSETTYTTNWNTITTPGGVDYFAMHYQDKNSVSRAAFLNQVLVGDVLVWYDDNDLAGRWLEFRITSIETPLSSQYKFGISLVEFDESIGTANISGTAGKNVELRFSRAGAGLSIHVSTIYLRSAAAPSTPSVDDGSYNFSTKVLTPPSGGWTAALPATTKNPLYSSSGTFSVNGDTGTDTTVTWSAPVKIDEGQLTIGVVPDYIILFDFNIGTGQAAVAIKVDSDGDIYTYQNDSRVYASIATWLGNGTNADYQVMFQDANKVGDTDPTGGTLDSWKNTSSPNSNRSWVLDSGVGLMKSFSGSLIFRDKANFNTLAQIPVTMEAEDA